MSSTHSSVSLQSSLAGTSRASPTGTRKRALAGQVSTRDLFSGKYTFGPTTAIKETFMNSPAHGHEQRVSEELKAAVESIAHIAEHVKAEMSDKKIRDDWKYISMVIDRLMLIIFFGITLGGTVRIILSAPYVFDFIDQQTIIQQLIAESKRQSEEH